MIHDGTENQVQWHGGNTVDHVHQTHQHIVHPSAEITGDTAHDHAKHHLNKYHHEADHQGNTTAVHQTRQKIHAVCVRSHDMLFRGAGIGINHPGLLIAGDQMLSALFREKVGVRLSIRIRVLKGFFPLLNGKGRSLLKVRCQEHASYHAVHIHV